MGLKQAAHKGKGKAVAGDQSSAAKRKRASGGDAKSSGRRRRTDPGVLRFFEDVAEDADGSDESEFADDDSMDTDVDPAPKGSSEPRKSYGIPFIPKEEVMDEEEFDKMMEQRYKSGSGFVSYPEDHEDKSFGDRGLVLPMEKDPVIWKVKCTVGREKYLVFCIMQKFVDLKSMGTKLEIISAFTVEHVKGFIFMEVDKQSDINAACNGLGGVYTSRLMAVPRDEVSRLFSIKSEYNEVTAGMWVRVKNGTYKGDLGQVAAVNKERKRATVKLIPRVDLLALTEKFGEGKISMKKTTIPAPRLISASELEEFRPLIQSRQDRDTGKVFEVLDGMMIKDGFLFKKISLDSLSCWGVVPTEEELLKFKTSESHESDDVEWLSKLYGEEKKKAPRNENIAEKGESSSGSGAKKTFEMHDLVCFGRKDFGVIIGAEKDDSCKILKEGVDGPTIVSVQQRELKSGPSNMKFTATDHRMKAICINDTVKVTEGLYEGKQGIVKLIYRGTIFLYDSNQEENGGYFCCKSRICEKLKHPLGSSKEKGGELDALTFEEFPPSPKSPLSPEKPFQARESTRGFNQDDEGNLYSIGQMLRIRVGPLKGYLCRVLSIRRSDVTVKLDSKQKVLTVKSEHLSEVQRRNPITSSEDPGSGSLKPFDLLGGDGGSSGWIDGTGTSGANDGWNAGGERSSWGNSTANPAGSNDEAKADVDDGWGSKVPPKKNNVSWGAQIAEKDQAAGGSASGAWDKVIDVSGEPKDSAENAEQTWGKAKSNDGSSSWDNQVSVKPSEDAWGKAKTPTNNAAGSWGNASTEKKTDDLWGKGKGAVGGGTWETKSGFDSDDVAAPPKNTGEEWRKVKSNDGPSSWDNQGSVKPSEDAWGKGKSPVDNSAGGWGDASAEKKKGDSWGKGKGVVGGGAWERKSGFDATDDGSNALAAPPSKPWETSGKGKSNDGSASWDKISNVNDNQDIEPSDDAWGKAKNPSSNKAGGWGDASTEKKNTDSWGKSAVGGGSWGNKTGFGASEGVLNTAAAAPITPWDTGKQKESSEAASWGNVSGGWGKGSGGSGGNKDGGWGSQDFNSAKKSSWNSESGGSDSNSNSAWGKPDNKSEWNSGGDRGGYGGRGGRGGYGARGGRGGYGRGGNGEDGGGGDRGGWGGNREDWGGGGGGGGWNREDGGGGRGGRGGNREDFGGGGGGGSTGGWSGGRGGWSGNREDFDGGDKGGWGGNKEDNGGGAGRGGWGGNREDYGGVGGRGGWGGTSEHSGGGGGRGGWSGGRGWGGGNSEDSGGGGESGRGGWGGNGEDSGGGGGRGGWSGGRGGWGGGSSEDSGGGGRGGWGGNREDFGRGGGRGGWSGNREDSGGGGRGGRSWNSQDVGGVRGGRGWNSECGGGRGGRDWNREDGGGGGRGGFGRGGRGGNRNDFGSRGRGRRDDGGGWKNNTQVPSWRQSEEGKDAGSGGGWSSGNSSGGGWSSQQTSGGGGGSGWKSTDTSGEGGWKGRSSATEQPGGWGKGTGSSVGGGGGWGSGGNSDSPGASGGWGSDGKPAAGASGGWGSGSKSTVSSGEGANEQSGGWGKGSSSSGGGGGSWGNSSNYKSSGGAGGWGGGGGKSTGATGGSGWGN